MEKEVQNQTIHLEGFRRHQDNVLKGITKDSKVRLILHKKFSHSRGMRES